MVLQSRTATLSVHTRKKRCGGVLLSQGVQEHQQQGHWVPASLQADRVTQGPKQELQSAGQLAHLTMHEHAVDDSCACKQSISTLTHECMNQHEPSRQHERASSAQSSHLQLHQLDAGKLTQVRVVLSQILTDEVKQLSCHLYACGATAHHNEGQQAPLLLRTSKQK